MVLPPSTYANGCINHFWIQNYHNYIRRLRKNSVKGWKESVNGWKELIKEGKESVKGWKASVNEERESVKRSVNTTSISVCVQNRWYQVCISFWYTYSKTANKIC